RLVTGPTEISTEEAERILFERRVEKLPLIDKDRRIRGLITKKDLILLRQRPHTSKDKKGRLLAGAAIGARGDYLERAVELIQAGADILVIDIAHGHCEVMRQAEEEYRKRVSHTALICVRVGTVVGG